MYKLPHELPNHWRLRILGNSEISRKSLKNLELMASGQLATQKSNFNNCAQKLQKICLKIFQRSSYVTQLCEFAYNILSMIEAKI